MLDPGNETDDVVAPTHAVSALEMVLVDRISKHNGDCSSAVAISIVQRSVAAHPSHSEQLNLLSQSPADKRDQLLEHESGIRSCTEFIDPRRSGVYKRQIEIASWPRGEPAHYLR
jgi:hypothetical protein